MRSDLHHGGSHYSTQNLQFNFCFKQKSLVQLVFRRLSQLLFYRWCLLQRCTKIVTKLIQSIGVKVAGVWHQALHWKTMIMAIKMNFIRKIQSTSFQAVLNHVKTTCQIPNSIGVKQVEGGDTKQRKKNVCHSVLNLLQASVISLNNYIVFSLEQTPPPGLRWANTLRLVHFIKKEQHFIICFNIHTFFSI